MTSSHGYIVPFITRKNIIPIGVFGTLVSDICLFATLFPSSEPGYDQALWDHMCAVYGEKECREAIEPFRGEMFGREAQYRETKIDQQG